MTPSASFRRGVRDHSFCAPKASNGSAIVNNSTTEFDLVVNSLGLDLPATVLARADEVIE
jgi:hypothetical protein